MITQSVFYLFCKGDFPCGVPLICRMKKRGLIHFAQNKLLTTNTDPINRPNKGNVHWIFNASAKTEQLMK